MERKTHRDAWCFWSTSARGSFTDNQLTTRSSSRRSCPERRKGLTRVVSGLGLVEHERGDVGT